MSSIFGVVSISPGSAMRDSFERMGASLECWGRDRRAHQVGESCCFAQYLLFDTPESRLETLPRTSRDPRLSFTAHARLDNRAELARTLGLDTETLAASSDGDLAWLAYRRWGEDCPHHLLGDWALAAWHADERRLFLARDHHGYASLLYHVDDPAQPRRIVFAPTRKALRAAGVPLRLNELHLAQQLISWSAYQSASTIDLDVQRLPPAHALRAGPDGVRAWQYWSPRARPELRTITLADAVTEFSSLYRAAVESRCRHRGRVAATLSGGLDSGSVALLAADVLKQGGERLLGLTHLPRFVCTGALRPGRFGDEGELAARTAQASGTIDHALLASENVHPLDGIEQAVDILDQPTHAGSNAFWIYDLMGHARQEGARVLLTGQGGNATVSWTGAPQFDSLLAYWRHLGTRQTIKRLLPRPLASWLLRLHRRRHDFTQTAIAPALARRTRLAERLTEAHGTDATLGDNARTALQQRLSIVNPGRTAIGHLWASNGAAFGMSVRDPTCDIRVLEYTLALPDRIFRGPDGQDRWLMRQAMQGLMPDAVRLNRARGRQSADLVQRLRERPERMAAALDGLTASAAANYVDLARLRGAWSRIQSHDDPSSYRLAVAVLLRGLNAALWINRQ